MQRLQGPLALAGLAVDVHVLKLEHHVQGARLWVRDLLGLLHRGARRFTNSQAVVMVQDFAAHFTHECHETRTVRHHLKRRLQKTFLHHGCVGQAFQCGVLRIRLPRLGDHVDHIHAETAHAFFQPEVHQVVNLLPDFGVLPIQVGLLFGKHVEVVLTRLLVQGPC